MQPLDLTPEQIATAFPGAKLENIALFWPYIREALRADQMRDAMIVAATLGTVAAETAGFVPMKEIQSKYNTRVTFGDLYDGRKDLGNTHPGDGGRFCGRGFVQLTGKANYEKYGEMIGVDLVADPDRANEPMLAAQLLALFVGNRETAIRIAIKDGNFVEARKMINGGRHGLTRFTEAYHAIMKACR